MLDLDTRAAILTLARRGHGIKPIARAVGVSRNTVRRVLESGQSEVPGLIRAEQLEPHLKTVRALHAECGGNVVRVTEELAARHQVEVAYSTLTAFCRRHGIGVKPKARAGRYVFEPGEEMQHDTSPHEVVVGGRKRSLQCASLVLCFSRKQYQRCFERWSRFECRVFLSEAIAYLGGSASRCMLDNSTVIIAQGTGKDAKPAAAMKALADRFGFEFVAHAVGHADRSGRVERPFWHVETNFYPGRSFADLADLNGQLRSWCDKKNARQRRDLGASPDELILIEGPALKPLPIHIPEVYELHRRRVDVEGFVNLHTNRYSVDDALIGRHVELRETVDRVRIFSGHELVQEHEKRPHGTRSRITLPEHRASRRWRRTPPEPPPQERLLRAQGPELSALIDALQRRHGGRAVKAVRELHRMWHDYPTEALRGAVAVGLEYGLLDIARLETMVLRRIAGDFFQLPTEPEKDDG